VTSILSIGQYYIERYYGRGTSRQAPPTLLERIRSGFWPRHADVPDVSEKPTLPEDHR
jgi:polar amino acid transport system permease protein